ncbi:MAG: RNA methyltransferase [Erysipelotrichaceae bacterium]|nr:RNA methyltransferase [Erysipelotrichaceae bacterium]
MIIESINNTKIKEFTKLHQKKYRDQSAKFLICDNDLALKYRSLATNAFSLEFENENTCLVNKQVIDKLSNGYDTANVLVMDKFNYTFSNEEKIIILDDVADPNNIGLILKAMVFYHYDLLVLSPNCADIYSQKIINRAKDAFMKIKFIETDILTFTENLKNLGYGIYATGLNHISKELKDVVPCQKHALILGNEGHGVSEKLMNISDEVIKIDMKNLDSLNVAMAGTIVMHHFNK